MKGFIIKLKYFTTQSSSHGDDFDNTKIVCRIDYLEYLSLVFIKFNFFSVTFPMVIRINNLRHLFIKLKV